MAKNTKIVFLPKAINNIDKIAFYIASKGFPLTAAKFVIDLYEFGDSIKNFPRKYPFCRHRQFKAENFRCAIYRKNYIFIYKIIENRIVIYNVIHVKALA